jgi:hypothetical protein
LAVPGEYRPMDMLEATNGAHGGGTALGRLPSL